jgi:hypothetical protein
MPSQPTTISSELAQEIAQETYIWGYPLVLMELTRKKLTNFEAPTGVPGQAPMNQFSHAKAFPPASFRDVVRPNFDTLYSMSWLDLGSEPLVMSLPKTDRYHVFQMMDGWSEVFAAPGSRMTGGDGGNYLIVGPNWKGDTPKDMDLLRSPTDVVWIAGRIQANGAEDFDFVHKLQAQIKLAPLSQRNKSYTPPRGSVDPTVDMKTPPMVAMDNMKGEVFFTALMETLKGNPPHVHDQGIVARLKRLGLEPGQSFDLKSLTASVQQALKDAPTNGLKVIQKRGEKLGVPVNGWNVMTGAVGYYGADYTFRAAVALVGLGANRPEDAIYPFLVTDGDGRPLSGANRFTLDFPKGQTPPVDAFWSITMYDDKGFPVQNAINRQAIGDRDKLTFADDGSLTLFIQYQSPGVDKESNWLPSPEGAFTLIMRCYSPRPEIASGEWVPPAVKRRAAEDVRRVA